MQSFYIFPSDSEQNILRGIDAGTWAVPIQKSKSSIIGKAQSMSIGDYVLLYLNGDKLLYGIFAVTELPDEWEVVTDIWKGRYELPFRFALSNGQNKFATLFAPDLETLLPTLRNGNRAWSDHVPKFRGMTIFQKQYLPDEDFGALVAEFNDRGKRAIGATHS